MLAWAATIHKVQGMEFRVMEVDFGLEGGNDKSDFYQGLAYMALSRAETVVVKGKLTVGLLNNINLHSLNWWLSEIEKWNAFKVSKVTPPKVFRNAVHQHNWQAAFLQSNVRKIVAGSQYHVVDPESPLVSTILRTADGHAPVPAPENDPAPDPVPDLALALALPLVPDLATPQGSAPPLASTLAPAPALAPTSAPSNKRPVAAGTPSTSVSASALDAPAAKRPDVSSKKSAKEGESAAPVKASAHSSEEFEVICTASAHAQMRWLADQRSLKHMQKRAACIQKLWNVCTEESKSYERNWDKGIPARHSSGFGEVEMPLISFLLSKHSEHVKKTVSSQTFVDIGSGLGKAVCLIATLQPQFKNCFGIELKPDRHAHAKKLAHEFTTKALREDIIFSPITLAEGSCLTAEICKTKLKDAGLVWINNEIFEVQLNQDILRLLTETVPTGCIVVSFKELFLSNRRLPLKQSADFKVISEELVANAQNWKHGPIKTFVIQRL